MNNKYCQSCGLPLKKCDKFVGTEEDGSMSEIYCFLCFENGKFLTPTAVNTAKKMQKYCIQEMMKEGVSAPFAWLVTRGIPRLKRWKI
jgi:hypothetical protein